VAHRFKGREPKPLIKRREDESMGLAIKSMQIVIWKKTRENDATATA
jgi:hypothetical protein